MCIFANILQYTSVIMQTIETIKGYIIKYTFIVVNKSHVNRYLPIVREIAMVVISMVKYDVRGV